LSPNRGAEVQTGDVAKPARKVVPFPSDRLTPAPPNPAVKQRVNVYLPYTTAERLHQVRQAGITYDLSGSAACTINQDVERLLGLTVGNGAGGGLEHRTVFCDGEELAERVDSIEQLLEQHQGERRAEHEQTSGKLDQLLLWVRMCAAIATAGLVLAVVMLARTTALSTT
jgi:hypothetical protein